VRPSGRLAGCSSWRLRVCGLFKWRQFEPEVILLAVGCTCASLCRTSRPRHRLEMGPAVCSGTGEALAPAPQAAQRLVAGGRDVRAGERQVGVFIPGCRLHRCDDRLPFLLFSAKRDAAAAEWLPRQNAERGEPSGAAGHHTDKHAGYCTTQSKGALETELPKSTSAVS
jgi:hypothetical protein